MHLLCVCVGCSHVLCCVFDVFCCVCVELMCFNVVWCVWDVVCFMFVFIVVGIHILLLIL